MSTKTLNENLAIHMQLRHNREVWHKKAIAFMALGIARF